MKHTLKYAVGLTAALAIITASAATFTISRIALTFGDTKPPAIIERGSELSAQAEISFAGNGLLKAAWEVAGPNPDGNNPQWRVLSNINQFLVGKDSATLNGPRLPTESTGSYLVRLRVIDPVPSGFEPSAATYNVIEIKPK